MKINPQFLKEITAKSLANKSTGVKGLINSIHKDTQLRDSVTLESIPLAPIPLKKGDNWHLFCLLATPQKLENGSEVFNPPWALIEWILPQGTVVGIEDLRNNVPINQLKSAQKLIKTNPADVNINEDKIAKIKRENILFELLDKLTSQPLDLENLAPHYSGLLPQKIYDYYWALIPETKQWLNPDITAINLDNITQEKNVNNPQNKVPISREIEENKVSKESNFPPEITELENEISGEENDLTNQSTLNKSLDLDSYLNNWLSQLHNLADSFNLSSLSSKLHNYEYRLLQPGFRLAIVGEFSRGKSNLINTILEEKIVPIGSLPTTSTLISIFPDPENKIEIYSPDKPVEIRDLNEESWSDLLATDPTGNNQEILAKIRVKVNNSWLEKLDVELIDTPGAGDLSTRRSALIFDLLSQCDAAVLVISATMALSLTEIAFLEEEIIGRHVPRILVVVTKLDQIKPEEKPIVFDHIKQRLGKISADIPLLSLHPVQENQTETETINLIQNKIEQMVDQGERKIWRNRQIANQLIDFCQQLKTLGEKGVSTANLDKAEREKEIKEHQEKISSAQIYWQQLELDLEQRRIKNYQQLETKITEVKNNLLTVLQFQLKKTTNPKSWWQDDLPFTLRKELVTFSRSVENFIIQKIAEDNSWLEAKVQQLFGQEIATILPVNNYNLDLMTNIENLPLADLQKYRLLTRLGSSAAVIGGYILGGPIGIIASTGIWLFGENMMNKTVEEQKETIEQKLEQKINLCFNQYCQKVADRLRQVYQQIINEIKQEEKTWKQNQQAIINKINSDNSPQEVKKWTELINQVNDIENSILTTIKS